MIIKKVAATFFMMLFCCILYAKEGYRIVLQTNSPKHEAKASLILSTWRGNITIDSTLADKKGNITFKGKKNLTPGEYIVKWNGKSIELFISDDGYTNEKFLLDGEKIVHKSGNAENGHFAEFQNLISYGWKSLPNAASLQSKIDSVAAILEHNLQGSLFNLMLNGKTGNRYLTDNRIANTRFGKKYLTDYLEEIEYNHNDTLITKADSLITQASDSIRPLAALEIYRYFSEPKIMGQESIACHVAEQYFLNKALHANQSDMFEMSTFVMLNKNSLLGMPAKELQMKDTAGTVISLHRLAGRGEYTILYFYTDDCIVCRIETPKLAEFANNYNAGTLNVYAVYTQDYRERWIKYIKENFNINNPSANWVNVWDPEIESGFHLVYNVISTPQIYLLDKSGTIIGRNLDVKALKELIGAQDAMRENMMLFISTYLSQYGNSEKGLREGIDLLYEKSKDNLDIFRDIFTALYNYLKDSPDLAYKESCIYLAHKYIIGMAALWDRPIFVNMVTEELPQMEQNLKE